MSRNAWIFLGVLLAGCGGPSIHQDYDPKEDFTKVKTWAWAPTQPQASGPTDPMAVSTLTQERIHRSVEAELTRKGMSQVDANSADVWVQHYAVVEQQVVVGAQRLFRGNDVSSYDKGTIIVDLVTPKTKRLVWRGTASDVVDPDLTPNERETRIQEAVKEILDQFPPGK